MQSHNYIHIINNLRLKIEFFNWKIIKFCRKFSAILISNLFYSKISISRNLQVGNSKIIYFNSFLEI